MRGPTLGTGELRDLAEERGSKEPCSPLSLSFSPCVDPDFQEPHFCVWVLRRVMPAGVGTHHDTWASELLDFTPFFSNVAGQGP